ncbi:hypothetical protein [Hymenobacter negativus]|uniref:Glycosyltransferase RgtA/B/C/D-like domain-containing protein n=1 Tax=Hymenobacter negativus TaxID=2795026 RepID=A0ABS3QD72_9BACT|nr:hypothetical protein [Hymenobacter negativus]MBO2009127.1 hypothetical protein [Hymenobacter negativus]
MALVSDILRTPWPVRWRLALVLALYAGYLPLSGYGPGDVRFDAAQYWELSLKFTQHGPFSLLAFDEPVRGYLGPLLLMPARLLCHFMGCSMLRGAQVLGMGWAALLFGLAIPQLWAQATGRGLSGGRWLVLVLLGFVFWRDYFNFPLSDMPALTLLLLGLVAAGQPGWRWVGVAGLLLGAAINMRPIYLASAPGWLWLLAAAENRQIWARRGMALIAGMALVLLPQLLINLRHFQQPTPLVLARLPGATPLYLRQLGWGTAFQRYETSLIAEIPRSLVYADSTGQQTMTREVGPRFNSYGQYLSFALRHPLQTTSRYLHHLFNGLDIWFPTPYPTQLHPPGQTMLRLLNYLLLGIGAITLLTSIRKQRPAYSTPAHSVVPVLLALLLPCLLVLPVLMECRFLLPLHLLLLTVVAGRWQPLAGWRRLGIPGRQAAAVALGVCWLWGCWQLSEATASQRRPPSEAPQE